MDVLKTDNLTENKLVKENTSDDVLLSTNNKIIVKLNDTIDPRVFEELKKYAEEKGVMLIQEFELTNDNKEKNEKIISQKIPSENERKRIETLEELKKLKQNQEEPGKKGLLIREISKVLTDLEELKKTKKIIYFSNLENKKVVDSNYKIIGKLKDLAISGGDKFPEVSHIVIKHQDKNTLISWNYVEIFAELIKLNNIYEKIETRLVKEDDVLLGVNILDQQVVDVNGLKVIRVNDIALTQIKNKLAVVNIDIGTRSMFRRLGYEKLIDFLHINVKDHPVPWNYVEPLVGSVEKIHLKIPCPRVSDLHPADIAELFDELSLIERTTILKSMKSETAAKVLLACEPDVQKAIIKCLKIKRIASIFEKMSPNDVVEILSEYNNEKITPILTLMNKEVAVKVQEMLTYKEGTIARHMNEEFISVNVELTVATALDYIRSLAKYPANFHYVYIVDDSDVLVGVMSLKQLVAASAEAHLKEIMVSKVMSVSLSHPVEYAEDIIRKYDLMALPVVDVVGKLKGIINIDDVLDIIINKAKKQEVFEITDEQKDEIKKENKLRKQYSGIVKDINKLMQEVEKIKPKKEDYLMSDKLFEKKTK